MNNEVIRGSTLEHLRAAFTRFYVGNYAPIQIVSYMADHALWGMRPAGYLLTNVVLHTVNGMLVYVLLVRVSGRSLLAIIAALLFVLHPVQVESVAWVSQRKNVLAMAFFLLGFHAWVTYRRRPGRAWGWYVATLMAYVLALLTKAVVAIFPLALVVYDLCAVERPRRGRWLLDKGPFVVATGLVVAITLHSQADAIQEGAETFGTGRSLTTLYTMLPVFVRYLRLLAWPAGLSAVYTPPVRTEPDLAVAVAGLVLLAMVGVGAWLWHTRRPALLWLAMFFLGLAPVSQIVPLSTLMNDRYLYLPMLGAAALAAAVVAGALSASRPWARAFAGGATGLALIGLGVVSWQRTGVWRDDVTLWSDVVEKAPASTLAWVGLGTSLRDANRPAEAVAAYERALSIDPLYRLALNNLGALYNEQRQPEKGRPYLQRVVQFFPESVSGHLNLGNGYLLTMEYAAAAREFAAALRLSPDLPQGLVGLGDAQIGLRDLDGARASFARAVSRWGTTGEIELRRACAESLSGRSVDAVRHASAALRLGIRDPERIENPCRASP